MLAQDCFCARPKSGILLKVLPMANIDPRGSMFGLGSHATSLKNAISVSLSRYALPRDFRSLLQNTMQSYCL